MDQNFWKPLDSGLIEDLQIGKATLYLECVFVFVKMIHWPFPGGKRANAVN